MNVVDIHSFQQDELIFSVALRTEDVNSITIPETCFFCVTKGSVRKIFPIKDTNDRALMRTGPEIVLNRYLPMCLAAVALASTDN